jgi:septal ring factor EnvC (AmiA/AmiB activator)
MTNPVTDAETRVLGDLDDVLIYEPYGFCEEPADVDMTRTDAFRDAVRALLASLATLREENARLEGQAIAALSDKIMRHETPDSRIARRDRRIAELEAEREAVRNALRRVLDANGNMINTRTNND